MGPGMDVPSGDADSQPSVTAPGDSLWVGHTLGVWSQGPREEKSYSNGCCFFKVYPASPLPPALISGAQILVSRRKAGQPRPQQTPHSWCPPPPRSSVLLPILPQGNWQHPLNWVGNL